MPRIERVSGRTTSKMDRTYDKTGAQILTWSIGVWDEGNTLWYNLITRDPAAVEFLERLWEARWWVRVAGPVVDRGYVSKTGERRTSIQMTPTEIECIQTGEKVFIQPPMAEAALQIPDSPAQALSAFIEESKLYPLRWHRPEFVVPEDWPEEWIEERERWMGGSRDHLETGTMDPRACSILVKEIIRSLSPAA